MSYTVRMRQIIVGRSELEHRDVSTGRARGTFRPGLGYELVQPIFRLRTESAGTDDEKRARYSKARDALGLELLDADGRVVARKAIDIIERTVDGKSDALELEVTFARPMPEHLS